MQDTEMDVKPDSIGPTARFDDSKQVSGESQSTGSYQTYKVQTIDLKSLAQDASEEMTNHEKLSKKSEKEASKREVKSGQRPESLERVMELNEISEILSKLGDLDQEQLEQAIKALLERKESDPHQLRERAGQQFEEPAHQYALLEVYKEDLKQKNASPEEIKTVETALEQMMSGESGIDIRAALNTGEVTNAYAEKGLGDHPTLRNAYRDNIKEYTDLNSTLADLDARFPGKNLEEAVAFITKSLAAELDIEGTSIDKDHLQLIISDMTWLKSSSTILRNCEHVVSKAQKRGALDSFSAESLCKEIATLQNASTVRGEQFSNIADKAGYDEFDFENRIVLLTDLTALIRLIPHVNFASEQRRDNFIDAAQTALDLEIKAEEKAEEECDDEDIGEGEDYE